RGSWAFISLNIRPGPAEVRALAGHYGVLHAAPSDHFHLDHVAWRERSDTGRCAGNDEVARLERHDARCVRKDERNREGHLRRAPALSLLAVHARHDLQLVQCTDLATRLTHRTEAVESLGSCPLTVTLLEVARGDVV